MIEELVTKPNILELEDNVLVVFNGKYNHYVIHLFCQKSACLGSLRVIIERELTIDLDGRVVPCEAGAFLAKQMDDLSQHAEKSVMGHMGGEKPQPWNGCGFSPPICPMTDFSACCDKSSICFARKAPASGVLSLYYDSKTPEAGAFLAKQMDDLSQHAEKSVMGTSQHAVTNRPFVLPEKRLPRESSSHNRERAYHRA
jgi:hypothetical protein